jgi:hypothetical protein
MDIKVLASLRGQKGSVVLDQTINWLPSARLPVKGDVLVFENEAAGESEHIVEYVEFCLTPNTFRVVVNVEDVVIDSKAETIEDMEAWVAENLPGWKVT